MSAAKSHLFIAVPPLRPWQWMQGNEALGPDARLLANLSEGLDFIPSWVPMANALDLSPLREGRAEILLGVAAPALQEIPLRCFASPHRMQGAVVFYFRKDTMTLPLTHTGLRQYRVGLADGVRLPAVELPATTEQAPAPSPLRGTLADLLASLTYGHIDILAAEAEAIARHPAPLPTHLVRAELQVPSMPLYVCLPEDADLMPRFEEMEQLYNGLLP